MENEVSRVAKVSRAGLMLLVAATTTAGLSGLSHTHVHPFSIATFVGATVLGTLALVKVANHLALHLPSPLSRAIHWMRAMLLEALALVTVALLRIVHLLRPAWHAVGPREGRPILLVHGYCNHSSVWIYLRYMLAKASIGPIYTVDLGSPFASLRAHVERLKAKIEEIREETRRSDIVLIGHSMGGLVSTLYATTEKNVAQVITIGSPLEGTHIARLALGACGREMRRKSDLLQGLAKKARECSSVCFHHIASRTDQLVRPVESALLQSNPTHQFLFEDIGHASMLFSPRVATQLIAWLKQDLIAKN